MRIALVTGATKGIGFSVTGHLLQNDFLVLALARHEEHLEDLRRSYKLYPLETYPCDVSNPDQVKNTVNAVSRKHSAVDLLINNAGVGYFESLESTSDIHWHETLQTNLSGPFYLTRECLPLLMKSDKPHVMNICSTASRKGFPGCTAYAASKFGLLGMTEVWREELRAQNIKVTAVIPGPVRTPFWQSFENDFDPSLMTSPESIAQSVLWIYNQPQACSIDEITIKPITGDL